MSSVIIHFSDTNTVQLNEGDIINPIVKMTDDGETFATMWEPVSLWEHIQNGLIPSLMDALIDARFFYVNGNFDVLYGVSAIVKIEVL